MKLNLAVDSGAFSLYRNKVPGAKTPIGFRQENAGVQANILSRRDFSFFKGPVFRKYFDDYMAYCHQNKDHLVFYVALDAIYDPKLTWELTEEMVRNGLTPLPVTHTGEDLSWFKKYLDKYEYVGLGGMGLLSTKPNYTAFAKAAFKMLLDSKGRPTHKVHGFAMASNSLMAAFPWASVDATSPFAQSRNGAILVPRPLFHQGKRVAWDFFSSPRIVAVTERRATTPNFYQRLPKQALACVLEFLAPLGFTDLSALGDEYALRDFVNVYYTYCVQKAIQERNRTLYGDKWRFRFFLSGKPSAEEGVFLRTLPILKDVGIPEINYLGTYWLPKPLNKFLTATKTKTPNNEKRRPAIRA